MLGAQALRTKQKAEQKEKEKRQRERLRSLELQRDKLHKAACEEAAAQYNMEISAQPPIKPPATKHRHSLHTSSVQHLQINTTAFDKASRSNGQLSKNANGPQRSTSSDYCREERKEPLSNSNKFMKWLGLGGSEKKDLKNRRMSTFT
ncbi:unnamed protein product [Cylicocyclus nassatus]|uniref:Uncharacterized protein n=1 Tax=Cylicocyclus nassatus TaxID=53992 RepID=A0AA36GWX4_CYLNA|nr:unnamed protein product [Cylicocyclus nassatus]